MEQGRTAVVERPRGVSRRLAVGLDLAGPGVTMALQGVSSIITTRADQLARWIVARDVPTLWVSPVALRTIAEREGGQGDEVAAVVAVPGWFGALDRAAARALLGASGYRVRIVSAPSAAATSWASDNRGAATERVLLCVDIGHGVSGAVVALEAHGAREVAAAALAPARASVPGAPVRPEVLTALVAQLMRRAEAALGRPVDVALVVGDAGDASLHALWPRVVAAATGAGEVQPATMVAARSEHVAAGAARLALADGGAAPELFGGVVAHPLGVVVDDGAGRRVMTVAAGGAPVPFVGVQAFAADASGPVRLELLESRRPGSGDDPGDWSPVATATWTGARDVGAGHPGGSVQVALELTIDSDGGVQVGPPGSWSVEVADGVVQWVGGTVPPVEGESGGRRGPSAGMVRVGAAPPAAGPAVGARTAGPSAPVRGRPLAWPATMGAVTTTATMHAWPPPGIAVENLAVDQLVAADEVPLPPTIELDDRALEEIACAEIGAPSLASALVDVERALSKHFGLLIGVRSAPALLACDDDADVAYQRAAGRRLGQGREGQPGGGLTEAVRAAIRAARRCFADPTRPLFAGGTAEAIAADAVQVAEHLHLVVGEVAPAERQRIVHDARLRGLSRDSLARVLHGVPGEILNAPESHMRTSRHLRDAAARVGDGHRGWSLEVHADPDEAVIPATRPGITQLRVVLLEPYPGAV